MARSSTTPASPPEPEPEFGPPSIACVIISGVVIPAAAGRSSLARLITAAVAIAWTVAACSPTSTPLVSRVSRPDIILVSIDTLRADHLNAYGYAKRRVSPNLDALAADSVLFESHLASAPWTLPSHASLLTSLAPSTHGVTPSLDEFLAPAGAPPALSESWETLAESLRTAGWATGAFTGGGPLSPGFGLGQGFDSYDASLLVKLSEEDQAPVRDWIASQRRPFFLFLHTFDVHSPYLRPDFLGEVVPPAVASRLSAVFDGLTHGPVALAGQGGEARALKREGFFTPRVSDALYDGAIRHTDAWLGELFAWLKQTGRYEDALIVVTSDHGEALGERKDGGFYNAHGGSVFDELIRVPLIIKEPGGQVRGARVRAVTRAIDVMPTILGVAGVAGPPAMEGRPIFPGVVSAPAVSEGVLVASEMKSVRDGRYKLIVSIPEADVRAHGRGYLPPRMAGRLFDIEADPGETRDLLRRQAFVDRLRAWVTRAPDPSVTAERLSMELRRLVRPRADAAGPGHMDEETRERLRSLGYVK